MIPKTLRQIWPGSDRIPEHLSILLAKNILTCKQFGYDHEFYRLTDKNELAVWFGKDHYEIIPLSFITSDERFKKMLEDPKVPYVMKGDILRFSILEKTGGFYADLDLEVLHFSDEWLDLPYVCGFERKRNGAGQRPMFNPHEPRIPQPITRENECLCTAFFGAPAGSQINKEMVGFILSSWEAMKENDCYPKNMWDVIDITVDPLVRIVRRYPNVKPFPMEVFFPWPIPQAEKSFSQHYYSGTQPGGWTFDQCKNEDCVKCQDKPTCKISREGRRILC